DGTDVDVLPEAIGGHQVGGDPAQAVHVHREADGENPTASFQALVVLLKPEDQNAFSGGGTIAADPFEYRGTVEKSVGQDAHAGVGERNLAATEIGENPFLLHAPLLLLGCPSRVAHLAGFTPPGSL